MMCKFLFIHAVPALWECLAALSGSSRGSMYGRAYGLVGHTYYLRSYSSTNKYLLPSPHSHLTSRQLASPSACGMGHGCRVSHHAHATSLCHVGSDESTCVFRSKLTRPTMQPSALASIMVVSMVVRAAGPWSPTTGRTDHDFHSWTTPLLTWLLARAFLLI